jgi:O-antigen/teichoic acid export membrane protein
MTNDPRQVTLFDIANQFFVVLMTTTLFIIALLVPFFTELSLKDDQREIQKWYIIDIKYMGIGFTVIAITFFTLGENLIEMIFGSTYAGIFENTLVQFLAYFQFPLHNLDILYQ